MKRGRKPSIDAAVPMALLAAIRERPWVLLDGAAHIGRRS
jgi:hypothetical protein